MSGVARRRVQSAAFAIQRDGKTMQGSAGRLDDIRPLTHEEIEGRIGDLGRALARSPATTVLSDVQAMPRWIASAEFVRRMRPFIVLN